MSSLVRTKFVRVSTYSPMNLLRGLWNLITHRHFKRLMASTSNLKYNMANSWFNTHTAKQFLTKNTFENRVMLVGIKLNLWRKINKKYLYDNFYLYFLGLVRMYFYLCFVENLQYLRLGDNNLHSIPSDSLRRLHRLRHLDLKANNISHIAEDAFTGFGDSITFLNLQKNEWVLIVMLLVIFRNWQCFV